MAKQTCVDLGFVEKCEDSWRLLSHYFPSKLGGSPSWLALTNLPNVSSLKCENCSYPCQFLLQIYSPEENDELQSVDGCKMENKAFHRTIFVFVCNAKSCNNHSLKCFRNQLAKTNKYYSALPPNEDYFDETEPYPKAADYSKLCSVCNCAATKHCSQCKKVNYCTRDHQTFHWKNGHKEICKGMKRSG